MKTLSINQSRAVEPLTPPKGLILDGLEAFLKVKYSLELRSTGASELFWTWCENNKFVGRPKKVTKDYTKLQAKILNIYYNYLIQKHYD